ncbi:hypothetical protein ACV229_05600 [Burkholderia sp. MR1-5-21]
MNQKTAERPARPPFATAIHLAGRAAPTGGSTLASIEVNAVRDA